MVFGCSVGCYEIICVHTALCFLVANSTTTVAVALELTQLHWNWAVCVCVCVCLVCMCLRHVLVAVDTFNAADVLCTEHHVAQGLILVRKHQRGKPIRQIRLKHKFRFSFTLKFCARGVLDRLVQNRQADPLAAASTSPQQASNLNHQTKPTPYLPSAFKQTMRECYHLQYQPN